MTNGGRVASAPAGDVLSCGRHAPGSAVPAGRSRMCIR